MCFYILYIYLYLCLRRITYKYRSLGFSQSAVQLKSPSPDFNQIVIFLRVFHFLFTLFIIYVHLLFFYNIRHHFFSIRRHIISFSFFLFFFRGSRPFIRRSTWPLMSQHQSRPRLHPKVSSHDKAVLGPGDLVWRLRPRPLCSFAPLLL